MSRDAVAAAVEAETLARLDRFAALLQRWQRAINLVSAATLPDLWRRHILDSLQLREDIPDRAESLVDLGSGAGFPGLVLGIARPDLTLHLVESDTRKAEFLRQAARETGTDAVVHDARIEAVAATGLRADIVTARALAPLGTLIALSAPFCHAGTLRLFPKGQGAAEEIAALGPDRPPRLSTRPSRTDPAATIIRIEGTDLG